MAKTKTPFFSLGAHGTVGKTLTAQKRANATMLRQTPTPKDPLTLAQQYQRWDYTDQAYVWHSLTPAQKAAYESLARPLHMTGYALWLRERLTDLPNIVARYHLDTITGNQTPDSSKNAHHGTVYGAYPLPGLIDQAFYFDGLDDRIDVPNHTDLNLPGPLSVTARINPTAAAGGMIIQRWSYNRCYQLSFNLTVGPVFLVRTATAQTAYMYGKIIPINAWYTITGEYDGINQNGIHITINGQPGDRIRYGTCSGAVETSPATPLRIGGISHYFKGLIDEVILENRLLDSTTKQRYAERRYPP